MDAIKKELSTRDVADRFAALAAQEKWFDIQDELFSGDVRSIEPETSPYLKNAVGKSSVRKKAEEWVQRIEAVHHLNTSQPIVGNNHFAVERAMDITVAGWGRIQINELMLYEVKGSEIVSEQFFY